jgi:HD superfamily phosphohydrolase
MRVGNVKVPGESNPVMRLCFDARKAIHVVEEYVQAREFMYVQVYIHKTIRAYEAMLRNALGLASTITDGDWNKAPAPCPPALAKVLACEPIGTDEYLSLDDFRLWCTFMDWARLGDGNDKRYARLRALCERLVNRGRPYRLVDMSTRCRDNDMRYPKAIEIQAELRNSQSAHSLYLDSFEDLVYRNIFYRQSKETEEQEDQAIQFVHDNGNTDPAEVLSYVIRAISEFKIRIHRLYYDETDDNLVGRLKKDGWTE